MLTRFDVFTWASLSICYMHIYFIFSFSVSFSSDSLFDFHPNLTIGPKTMGEIYFPISHRQIFVSAHREIHIRHQNDIDKKYPGETRPPSESDLHPREYVVARHTVHIVTHTLHTANISNDIFHHRAILFSHRFALSRSWAIFKPRKRARQKGSAALSFSENRREYVTQCVTCTLLHVGCRTSARG